MAQENRLKRPGFGLPLEDMPTWSPSPKNEPNGRFPHAIADFFASSGITCREQRMLDFVNQVTDKPRWWEKVHDEEIVSRWREEACGNDEQQKASDKHLNHACFDYCLEELRDKAEYLDRHGVIHILDVDATIVKADSKSEDSFPTDLRGAAWRLEDIPDRLKDWHPGSDGLVLDLLHPSLFPLQYGVSRVLPTCNVPLEKCVHYTGCGEICPVPDAISDDKAVERKVSWGNPGNLKPYGSYQWLPSEVQLNPDAQSRITSYVNNLHPEEHLELYRMLEKAVDRAIPMWSECLSWFHNRMRINVEGCGYKDFFAPTYPGYQRSDVETDGDDPESEEDNGEMDWERQEHFQDWLRDHPDERLLLQPSPTQGYVPLEQRLGTDSHRRIDLQTDYKDGLQVIFKLANIHLTPENPRYDGSNWHVEGALNEHICATALFYYGSENIDDSFLEFRQHMDAENMVMKPMQHEYEAAEQMYGIENETPAIQKLGSVLTREGRWIAFPNVMQHRVTPFELKDKTKPGHRKILAMFLIDPHIKILSTANVPPQRRDWWAEEVRKIGPFAELPVELFDRVIESVDDFPIGWEEACTMRETLMEERGRIREEYDQMIEEDTFYFCEH